MCRGKGTWVLIGLALVAALPVGCESTAPLSGCVKCRCECQGTTGKQTTTFENRNSQGQLVDLTCTVKGDCVAECGRIGAPTPLTANCMATR